MIKQYSVEGPSNKSGGQGSETTQTPPVVPMCDRISNAEATVLAVVAEHGMPLSCTPTLVSLAKTLAQDSKALSEIKLDRTAAAYKTEYGLAESFHQKLVAKLRICPFSLNLDEATSSNKKKVLTVLALFYDTEMCHMKIEHLQSVEIKKTDSETIYNAIVKLVEENEIPWVNLTSVLMDSCSVMRGRKSSVETRLRREKVPHLLDIDGDSCHHMRNSSKKLCALFEYYLERMFNDMHADFVYCSEYSRLLAKICDILGVTFSKPARFIPHRWLSAYDLSVQTTLFFDAYLVFYFSFLKGEDRQTYRDIVEQVLKNKNVSAFGKKKVKAIQATLSAKK